MKLYTFQIQQQRRIGAELGGQLVDLAAGYSAYLAAYGPKEGALRTIPSDMLSFIRLGRLALEAARETLSFFAKRPALPVGEEILHSFEGVSLLAPIPRPGKILCVGSKCPGDQASLSGQCEEAVLFFAKFPSTVIGPGEQIIKPRLSEKLSYGLELGVVIGKRIQAASEEQAASGVFGYTILNDITACDQQQSLLGKNFDTFCPIGPCIVTPDEVPDPENLRFTVTVNGKEARTGSLEFGFTRSRVISELSRVVTLDPGDILGTGGPAPIDFLSPGDELLLQIEGIGQLLNRIAPAA